MIKRRNFCLAFLLVCCLVAVFPLLAASLPKYGGTLHLSLLVEPASLDPLRIMLSEDRKLCSLIYDTLVIKDKEGSLIPHLASSWETSSDGKTWTFHLREGLTFHNGRKLTSKDVAYTLKRAMFKGSALKINPLLGGIAGVKRFLENPNNDLSGISTIGEFTVQITLNQLDYSFLEKLASPYLAVLPAEEVNEKGNDFFLSPIGSGPFQFTSWEKQRQIVLTSNENYFLGRSYVDKLDFSIIDDPAAGVLKFELQELDVYDIPSSDYQRFRDNQQWRDKIKESPNLTIFYLGINCQKSPLSNMQARKALNYAIDRQSIIDILLAGQGNKATGVLPSSLRKTLPNPKGVSYDPQFAKKQLASSISADELRKDIIFWLPTTPPELIRIAERIQVNLLDAGLNVRLQQKSWGDIYRSLQLDVKGEKPHLFLLYYEASNDNPAEYLTEMFTVNGSANFFNYSSDKVDKLLTLAKQASSLEERFNMLAKVETAVLEDTPAIFLYDTSRKIIFQPKVMDLQLNLSQLNLNQLWLRQ